MCKEQYGRKTSLALWVLIELAIIGCDLQEIVGSAIAFQVRPAPLFLISFDLIYLDHRGRF